MAGWRRLAAWGLSFWTASALFVLSGVAAKDLDVMSRSEIVLLQRRLQETGCFRGPQDGLASPMLREALQKCPDPTPFLSLEAGGLTGPARRVAVNAACTVAATTSYDKTVRLWSLPEGRMVRAIRFPFSPGDEFDGLAMSPDGRWIAAGGWDAREEQNTVFLLDTATNLRVRALQGFANQIGALAFSPDGSRLAIAAGDDGIRILAMPEGRPISSDTAYSEMTNAMAFAPDGSLYVASYDGSVRRYDASGAKTHQSKTRAGEQPYTLGVSRDGMKLAIGFADTSQVELLDARTLESVALTPSKNWADDNISRVAWDAAGHVVAGGDTSRPASPLHLFDADGRHQRDLAPIHYMLDLQPCGDGTILSAVEPGLALLGADGSLKTIVDRSAADMRFKSGEAFKVSADGMQVRFDTGYGDTGRSVLVDLTAGTVAPAPADMPGLFAPITDTLAVNRNSGKIDRSGRTPAPSGTDRFEARSLAIRPDRAGFLLGSWSKLRSFDGTGKLRWSGKSAMPVGGVQLAANGTLAIVAYLDGTLRWFRWSDGAELLSVFVDRQDLRFVAWTPGGYYAGSTGAEALFGWQFNSDWSRPAEFLPAAQTGLARLRRLDVIQKTIALQDEALAVRFANAPTRDRL